MIIIIIIMIRRRRRRRIKKVKAISLKHNRSVYETFSLFVCWKEMVYIYTSIHSSFQYEFMVFRFSFFFFFARRDVRDPFFLLLFYFLKLITYSYHLLHFFQYDTKRNLMFYQSISVKHRLSVLCFDNIRVDVDNYFLCLVTAV